MPFITITHCDGLISKALSNVLSADSNALFDKLEPRVAEIITRESGIEPPTDTDDTPSWLIVPASWIMAYIADDALGSKSEAYTQRINANYESALETLRSYRKTAGAPRTGTIEGLWEG